VAALLLLTACEPDPKFSRSSPVAILASDNSGVVFTAYPSCKDPTVTITDLSFDVDGKPVWETHFVDRSQGGARSISIDKAPEGYSSVTHDKVTLERVLSADSKAVLYMHITDSAGKTITGTWTTARTKEIDAERAGYWHDVVSRKELGC
jgi:hypothetical protein